MPGPGPRRASGTAASGDSDRVRPKQDPAVTAAASSQALGPVPSSQLPTDHTAQPVPKARGPRPAPRARSACGCWCALLHEALIPPRATRDGNLRTRTWGARGPDLQGTRRASVHLPLTLGPQTVPPSQGHPGDGTRPASPPQRPASRLSQGGRAPEHRVPRVEVTRAPGSCDGRSHPVLTWRPPGQHWCCGSFQRAGHGAQCPPSWEGVAFIQARQREPRVEGSPGPGSRGPGERSLRVPRLAWLARRARAPALRSGSGSCLPRSPT